MQRLLVLQSLWAMERRHTDGVERTVEANVEMIAGAGFDGISTPWTDRDLVRRMAGCLRTGMVAEGVCFPKTVDELKPVLEIAAEFPVHHINLQPDVRPRRLEDCVPLIEGWRRLAEQVDFPVLIETHRDRMTTDLYFTLDLLDRFPELPLLADLSHFLVGREFAWPVSDENHALIHRILENSWAFHGRVASREQVQIEIAFPHHQPWVDLFLDWWGHGFRSWRRRAAADATLSFTCELGPQPYAITGRDGNDTTDRWAESLTLAGLARDLWAETARG
ncbi:sugar phosphate isomerase/epimerase family protein [Inquilinus sp. CA228]|uniref:sugar phosphate isomerase/epimerase family protein n=1 Tax=Inquilinus sp. CA228 TaxID=3455609 RepID=UPI003F8D2AE8